MTDAASEATPADVVPALTARAARGDATAYSALVARYYASCLRYAEHMLGDRLDAEDTVQETFLRAHLAMDRYDDRQQFKSWIFQILANHCRTMALQRARRARRFPRDETALRTAPSPRTMVSEQFDTIETVRSAVNELEPLLREAFLLKYAEEMSYEEIATILGASVSALKMRVKRACDALRPRLEEIYRDD
jgi:RNA polymerase sigma-70 factor (ECF subfamily)